MNFKWYVPGGAFGASKAATYCSVAPGPNSRIGRSMRVQPAADGAAPAAPGAGYPPRMRRCRVGSVLVTDTATLPRPPLRVTFPDATVILIPAIDHPIEM